jgi:hypothetical protein
MCLAKIFGVLEARASGIAVQMTAPPPDPAADDGPEPRPPLRGPAMVLFELIIGLLFVGALFALLADRSACPTGAAGARRDIVALVPNVPVVQLDPRSRSRFRRADAARRGLRCLAARPAPETSPRS